MVLYRFENLQHHPGLEHAVFTRRGGVSPPPFDSLNLGSTVGDDDANVQANRLRMASALGVSEADTRTTWQVHGADVVVAWRDEPQGWPPPKADAIITGDAGVALVMRFADCVPILLYDPVRRVAGLAHAGWRGTLAGVAPAVLLAMHEAFGTRPADVVAGIGPAIGPCCYEVGPEVVAGARECFPGAPDVIVLPVNGHGGPHFDLWAANAYALRRAGVEHVEVAGLCTSCQNYDFFSHRAEAGQTGRFGVGIALKEA